MEMKHFASQIIREIVIISLICAPGCSRRKEPVKETWLAMGTFAAITVADQDCEYLDKYASTARDLMRELENSLSVFKPDSEVSRINQSAGQCPVPVSDYTREVLELTRKYVEISGGCFDPTIAPLVQLWGFNGGTVPDESLDETSVRSLLRCIGYGHLVLSGDSAYLDTPDMQLDLGGIAKGYAVDVCYRKLMEMKAENVMINLGGNIRCHGMSRGNKPWKVGVRNPFDPHSIIGTISLTEGMAVATSGNYERFVTIGNKRYAHIIDPRTGYPVRDMAGVTVISTSAVEADAMSTALFVLSIEEGGKVLSLMPQCHALFIPDKQPLRIWVTHGFAQHFTPEPNLANHIFELTTCYPNQDPHCAGGQPQ